MWSRLRGRLASFLHPFGTIASELRIIRELYELDLSSRTPPLIRITESPSRRDTEVSYAGQVPRRGGDFEFDEPEGLDD